MSDNTRIQVVMVSLKTLSQPRSMGVLIRFLQNSPKRFSSVHRDPSSAKASLPLLNFTDPVMSFTTKTNLELMRSIVVFTICQIRPLVRRSDKLLKFSYRLLGPTLTNGALRLSFFNHFCAGEDERGIKPKVDYLHENGIGSILDYAAEADIASEGTDNLIVEKRLKEDFLQARVYDYKDESLCDSRADTFRQCILAVHSVSPTGLLHLRHNLLLRCYRHCRMT